MRIPVSPPGLKSWCYLAKRSIPGSVFHLCDGSKHFPSFVGFWGGEVRWFTRRATCSVWYGKDAVTPVVRMRMVCCTGRHVAGGRSCRRGQIQRAMYTTKGTGIHPGDNGQYRSFSPKLAWWDFHEFPELWITALRKEAKWAPARSIPAVLAKLEVYFLKSLPGKSVELYHLASGPIAEGNEMHQRRPGRVLRDRCN